MSKSNKDKRIKNKINHDGKRASQLLLRPLYWGLAAASTLVIAISASNYTSNHAPVSRVPFSTQSSVQIRSNSDSSENKIKSKESESLADKIMREFPDKIPGASNVEKTYAPGAESVLIHLRMFHEDSGLEKFMKDVRSDLDKLPNGKEKREVSKFLGSFEKRYYSMGYRGTDQRNCFAKIFDTLISKYGISNVYSEGITLSSFYDLEKIKNYNKKINEIEHALRDKANYKGTEEERILNLARTAQKKKELDKLMQDMLPEPFASYFLAGKINILITESEELNERARAEYEKRDYSNLDYREDFTVNRMLKEQSPLIHLVVYGVDHDFRNNASAKGLHCITITPSSYARDEAKQNAMFDELLRHPEFCKEGK